MTDVKLPEPEYDIKSIRAAIGKLGEKIESLSIRLGTLENFVDANDARMRDEIGNISLMVSGNKTILYGSSELRFKGLVDRLEVMEKILKELVDERRIEKERFKGLYIGLGITSATGVGTLVTLLNQIFS